jgi:hypothetical protein
VHEDPRLEIMKHPDGDLEIHPSPAEAGQRHAEISGRVKPSSLLAEEEAAFLRLVAGGRIAFTATGHLEICFVVVV